jgi:hypothetical protein
LNQLPEPIVPLEFYERFREPLRIYQEQVLDDNQAVDADKFDHAKAVETYQRLIIELPPLNKQLLLYILDLLAVFASKSDQNRMTSANLSAIFQPGMLSHPQHDMAPAEYKLSQDVLIFLIENQDHFLVGMSGTCADEQQMKEVEAGIPSRPTTTQSNVRRSVSSASAGTESQRKLETIRRNVSVSSRNSRTSNNAPSPGTPTSSGGGVHRSNTLPSKMGPVVASARFTRSGETASNNPSGLSVSHQSSRSASRTPSVREEPEQRNPSLVPSTSTAGSNYVHTSTHGPVPVSAAKHPSTSDAPRPQENLQTPASPPPQVVTPTRERKLSTLFSKSPPPEGEQKEPRQPNRLKKKRIPGSASMSAQSSSNSLHRTPSELNVADASLDPKRERQSIDIAMGDITPKPPTTTNMSNLDATSDSTHALGEGASHPNHDTSLRPHQSRTPSMNSRSSFTDQSDYDQPEDTARSERRDNRRSWRFQRASKRSSEQVGLGLASPPLVATNPGADQSSSSIGSGQHTTDPSSQPLRLDAGVQSSSAASVEPEKKSLFGKFKAKVAQVRDGVKDDRERAKSPNQSDTDPSSSQPLSPTVLSQSNGKPTIDMPTEPPKEEPVRSPMSPLPGAGMPPSIPEEPHSPEAPTKVPDVESKEAAKDEPASTSEAAPAPEAPVSEAPKETAEKEASA